MLMWQIHSESWWWFNKDKIHRFKLRLQKYVVFGNFSVQEIQTSPSSWQSWQTNNSNEDHNNILYPAENDNIKIVSLIKMAYFQVSKPIFQSTPFWPKLAYSLQNESFLRLS